MRPSSVTIYRAMRLPLPIDMVPSLLVLLFIEHATTQVKCSPALSISSQGRMSEATAAAGGLQALFSKPRKLYENVGSGTVQISSTPVDMVYIRSCSNCELRGTTKLAKCIIESCSNVKVAFQEPILSGTLELIDCENVSIFINPRDALPTVSAERCHTLHLHYIQPKSLGSVYTVQCSDVTVHFKPPHKEEYVLELPSGGTGNDQFVSSLSGEEMVTEKVIREGAGYATTATKQAEAERREKELMRRFEEHLLKTFNIGPPPSSSSTRQPPPTTDTSQPPPTTDTSQPPDTTGEGRDKP